jgi:nitrite reductase/ring-hydroxylating ferredoxin subunit
MNTDWQQLVRSYVAGHALPRALYQGDDLYEAEIRAIFLRSWLCVGHQSQVAQSGDYFLFEMAGESVIVIRAADGGVNALLNVCRHRGSRICDPPTGHESRLVCRYHGWTYGLDGSLRAAAHMPPAFARSTLGLRRLHVKVLAGLVFINFAAAPPPFTEIEADLTEPLRPYGLEHAKVAERRSTRSRPTGSSRSRTTASAITVGRHTEYSVAHSRRFRSRDSPPSSTRSCSARRSRAHAARGAAFPCLIRVCSGPTAGSIATCCRVRPPDGQPGRRPGTAARLDHRL